MLRLLLCVIPLLFSSSLWAADFVWATRDMTAQRWEESATPTAGEIKKDDRLEVVYKTDTLLRVRLVKDRQFGWIPGDAVTQIPPEGAAPASPPTAAGAGEPFNMEGLSPDIQEKLRQFQEQQQNEQPE